METATIVLPKNARWDGHGFYVRENNEPGETITLVRAEPHIRERLDGREWFTLEDYESWYRGEGCPYSAYSPEEYENFMWGRILRED